MQFPMKKLASKVGAGAVTAPIAAYETWARIVARGIQFVFALVVIALYGHRIDVDRRAGIPQDPSWMYALTIGAVSSITCALFILPIPFMKTHRLFIWDSILFIFWIACFGVFAKMYLHKATDDPAPKGTSNRVMKVGIWIDLLNAVLWMLTAIYGAFRTMLGKKIDKKIEETKGKAMTKLGV